MAPAGESYKILVNYKNQIEVKTRTEKFGEVKVQFKEEKLAEEIAGKKQQPEKWVRLFTYMA